jgi:hypothetical protein
MTAGDDAPDAFREPPVHSVDIPIAASGEASLLTLAALGTVAFVAETMLHEAGGHGGVCLATGGRITLLAPLYMRCSVVSPAMVRAGPAMNFLSGAVAWLALQAPQARVGAGRYFLWLSLAFNWLVAAGYLLVGAATGFGDWSVLFQRIEPSWHWRVPAGAGALLFYCGFRWVAGRELTRLTGIAKPDAATLGRLVLVPTGAAAVVALGAQAYGQGSDPLGLALAFGSTFFVGLTLLGIEGRNGDGPRTIEESRLRIGHSVAWLTVAALVAAVFVLFIGPGADLSAVGR